MGWNVPALDFILQQEPDVLFFVPTILSHLLRGTKLNLSRACSGGVPGVDGCGEGCCCTLCC